MKRGDLTALSDVAQWAMDLLFEEVDNVRLNYFEHRKRGIC